MTVRKNFLFDEDVAQHLKEIAKKANITQTQVVKNLIEAEYEEVSVEEKLEALQRIVNSSKEPNPFMEQFDPSDPKVLQKVKGMMY